MNPDKKSKHILILGGMGPQASVYAHSLLLKAAAKNGAVDNEDYPRITHLSVNVKDFISSPAHRQEACDFLIQCLREIDISTVDSAFIACNTAHILLEELEAASGLRFTSLINTTIAAIQEDRHISKLGILATPSTLATNLYSSQLGKVAELIQPTESSSRRLEAIIRDVIGGGNELYLADMLAKEVDNFIKQGAQKVVLGCTELSLLGAHLDPAVVIDPLRLTTEEVLTRQNN